MPTWCVFSSSKLVFHAILRCANYSAARSLVSAFLKNIILFNSLSDDVNFLFIMVYWEDSEVAVAVFLLSSIIPANDACG